MSQKPKRRAVQKNPKFERISSILLAQYANKMLAYMNDIRRSLTYADHLLKNHKDILGDYNIDKAGNFFAQQLDIASAHFNEIQQELELRCTNDTGFVFDYYNSYQFAEDIENFVKIAQSQAQQNQQGPGPGNPGDDGVASLN